MVEDVELCLEVQVDPDSKKILANPQKCRSALLDVTVLKPKELEAFGTQQTNTLKAAEVRKLIASLEKQRRKKQKVLDKLKCDDTIVRVRKHEDPPNPARKVFPKRRGKNSVDDLERKDFIGITESVEPLFCEIKKSLKNVETTITSMQDINLVISQTTVDESASEAFVSSRRRERHAHFSSDLKNPSVFRVEAAPHDLKSVLVCENKCKYNEQSDKVQGKCFCENCGIVGLLMECQKHSLMSELSTSPTSSSHYRKVRNKKTKTRFHMSNYTPSRVRVAEEAYVMQLTDRVKVLERRLALQEEKIIPKDYFKKVISKVLPNFSPNKELKVKSNTSLPKSEKTPRKSSVRQEDLQIKTASEPEAIRTDKSTLTEGEIPNTEYTWKWGEEILKPGIDLKNRIVNLLNDIVPKFTAREKVTESPRNKEISSDTLKKFIAQMNNHIVGRVEETKDNFAPSEPRYYKSHAKPVNTERRASPVPHEKKKTPRESVAKKENLKNINVSYVNPKLSQWQKDSHSLFKGREEFLKIVGRAKQYQKDILWRNIWGQAKANNQTKGDKLTIKIPIQSKVDRTRKDMLETEMTIGEVEMILKNRH